MTGDVARTDERGSGSLLALAVACVLVLTGLTAATLGSLVVARRQASTAAEMAALSAAARPVEEMESACATAQRVARAHRSVVLSCAVNGLTVDVVVAVRPTTVIGQVVVVRSRARAGRTTAADLEVSRSQDPESQEQFAAQD